MVCLPAVGPGLHLATLLLSCTGAAVSAAMLLLLLCMGQMMAQTYLASQQSATANCSAPPLKLLSICEALPCYQLHPERSPGHSWQGLAADKTAVCTARVRARMR